jgi:hypothetical protein
MKKQNGENFEGYTRVTEILSAYTDFSHIEPSVLANAADRGTRVHRFCELYVKNLLIEPVDEDCKPYVDSFISWFDFIVDEVIQAEQRLFCDKWKITGQIDLIVKMKNSDSIYIVDIKTPQQSSKSWALQTSAYKHLVETNSNIKVGFRGCLMLDRQGGEPKMVGYENHDRDAELFFSACKLHQYFKGI